MRPPADAGLRCEPETRNDRRNARQANGRQDSRRRGLRREARTRPWPGSGGGEADEVAIPILPSESTWRESAAPPGETIKAKHHTGRPWAANRRIGKLPCCLSAKLSRNRRTKLPRPRAEVERGNSSAGRSVRRCSDRGVHEADGLTAPSAANLYRPELEFMRYQPFCSQGRSGPRPYRPRLGLDRLSPARTNAAPAPPSSVSRAGRGSFCASTTRLRRRMRRSRVSRTAPSRRGT